MRPLRLEREHDVSCVAGGDLFDWRESMTSLALLVGLYHEPVLARARELVSCLTYNMNNSQVARICILAEDAEAYRQGRSVFKHPKVTVVDHGRRVRYTDLFDWANRNLPGNNVIIANADIYFDDSLALLASIDLRDMLLCLSRWDVCADGSAHLFEYAYSQDAWIFRSPYSINPVRLLPWHPWL